MSTGTPLGAGVPADAAVDALGHDPLAWARELWKRTGTNRSLGLAAEMAFWLFLSLLPLSAVAGLVTAKLAATHWSTLASLLESLPPAMRDLIAGELGRMAAWNGGKVGLSAGLVFVWLASSGVQSIFDGIELESDAAPRPWWKKRLIALGTCVALSVGVAIVTSLGAGLGWLWHLVGGETWLRALQLESGALAHVVRLALGALLSVALVCGLYEVALPPDVRRHVPVLPGALVAIGLQTVLGFGYGFYIQRVGDGGAYQAGLASIGVTLMALYLFCLALLFGSKVNQMVGEQRGLALGRGVGAA